MMSKVISIFCLLVVTSSVTHAQVKLPRLISDSMILQRNKPNNIWGWAAAGETVNVNVGNKKYSTVTGADGKWLIRLPPAPAGPSFNMRIEASNTIELKGLLYGDVWVCSGQSNMELPMERVREKYPDELYPAPQPFIRQFNVSTKYELRDMLSDYSTGSWESVHAGSIARFTAVGYFFAKDLYNKYHVPVGLIKVAVGGSPAEAWLSDDALLQFPVHAAVADKFRNPAHADSVRNADQAAMNAWYNRAWTEDRGMHENKKWFEADYASPSWQNMQVPGYWTNHGLKNTNGVVWVRKEIDLPASVAGKAAVIRFGNVVDRDSLYINGRFIGTVGYQYPPRKYAIPAGILTAGKNIISIKVINSAGNGGFYEDKPYYLAIANDTVLLTGDWQYQLSAALPPAPATTTFHYLPGSLFRSMISPALNYSIKGVIWYQGESNAGRPAEYRSLFPAVIRNWRSKWKQGDFPFLYVQLANYMRTHPEPSESNWAMLREAQVKTLSVLKTAMVVTTDIGEWNDIHPLNKKDVGTRLALAARSVAYNEKNIVYAGPLFKSAEINDHKIVIRFSNCEKGLKTSDGKPPCHFAIAGADKKFVWANAEIRGSTIMVWNTDIPQPKFVRYAWADNPACANVTNMEGLPASSFRTDGDKAAGR